MAFIVFRCLNLFTQINMLSFIFSSMNSPVQFIVYVADAIIARPLAKKTTILNTNFFSTWISRKNRHLHVFRNDTVVPSAACPSTPGGLGTPGTSVFETADLIGFSLFDSIQSNRVFPEPLVSRAQAQPVKRDKRLWGRE